MLFTKYVVTHVTLHTLVSIDEITKRHIKILFFQAYFHTDHSFDFYGNSDIEPHYHRHITSELVNIHAQTNSINIQQDLD